jgi:Tol biopolymer transport system component
MPTGGLFTVPFDPKRRAAVGNPTPILADIQPNGGVSPFIVTKNGTLVYRAGMDPEYRLLVRDARGKKDDSLPVAPRVLSYARFSPDGRFTAMTIGSARGTNRHTAIYDLSLGTLTPFTMEGGGHSPVWSPDGTRLAFTAEGQDTDAEDLFVQPVDRSNPANSAAGQDALRPH